jgi:hypothetical protein
VSPQQTTAGVSVALLPSFQQLDVGGLLGHPGAT